LGGSMKKLVAAGKKLTTSYGASLKSARASRERVLTSYKRSVAKNGAGKPSSA